MSENKWIAQVADDKEALSMAESELKKLTPEGLLTMYRLIQRYEDQVKVPEAQGSASTYMRGPGGAEILVVSRGVCIESAWQDLETFVIERIKQGYAPVIKYPEGRNGVKGKDTTTGDASKPAGSSSSSSSSLSEAEREIRIVRLEVTPLEGDRSNLDFFAENHKYADLKIQNWKNESILKLLEPTGSWSLEDLRYKKSWMVSMIAEWKPSDKLNSRGEPYKNVTALRPTE